MIDGIRIFLFDLAVPSGLASAIVCGQVQSVGGCMWAQLGEKADAPRNRLMPGEIRLPMAFIHVIHKHTACSRRANDETRALPCNLPPYIDGSAQDKT